MQLCRRTFIMAEETDDILVSNEANKNGEEKSPDHSTGKPRATKKVPHYLRASTGSCHDACKHGTTHKFKDKPIPFARRRISAPLRDGKKTVDIQIYVDEKVQKAVQSDELELPSAKEPTARKSLVHDSSKLVKQEARSFTKSTSPDAPKLIRKPLGESSLSDNSTMSKQKVASAAKKNISLKRTPLNPKERKSMEGPLKPNGRGEKPPMTPLSNTLKISKSEVAQKSISSKQTVMHSQGRNSKPNSTIKKSSSSLDSLTRLSGKQSGESKIGNNLRTSRVAVRNTVAPSAATTSLRKTSKVELKRRLLPSTAGKGLKVQNQSSQDFAKNQILANNAETKEPTADEKVVEKTLHMIEMKEDKLSNSPNVGLLVQSPSPLSPDSLNSSSQTNSLSFTSHEIDDRCELDSEYTDTETEGSISNYNSSGDSKAADGMKDINELTGDSEGRNPEPLKLNFRKGKVVEHQSETDSLIRLKFRQGTILGDNQDTDGGAQRKRYRKKTAVDNKKEAETGLVKVVLKHQEMETKKEEQVSLNNVIEETASKLVEKRKSKVKALVGAFETVISLQEPKPPAANR